MIPLQLSALQGAPPWGMYWGLLLSHLQYQFAPESYGNVCLIYGARRAGTSTHSDTLPCRVGLVMYKYIPTPEKAKDCERCGAVKAKRRILSVCLCKACRCKAWVAFLRPIPTRAFPISAHVEILSNHQLSSIYCGMRCNLDGRSPPNVNPSSWRRRRWWRSAKLLNYYPAP